jgi:cyclopropane-fatty-acyl-phospholipid synthase
MKFKSKKKCNVCNKNFHNQNSINLPRLPITEIFLKSPKYKNKILYDQKLKYCENCHHMQLQNQYDTSFFYNQSYLTSSTNSYSGRYTNDIFYEFIKKNIDFSKKYKILEVGANDLYLIKKLKNIINIACTIDPCIKPDKKIKKVQYIKKFLEDTSRSEINFVPDIIICSHTLEHIEDPKKFIDMITRLGNDKTMYFFQFPSCESLIDRKAFDQIHHQHFNYFSINSISKLLKRFKLNVKKYEIGELHYGSLMIYFKKSKSLEQSKKLEVVKSNKKLSQIYNEYKSYMESLIKIIKKYKKRGSKIYGIGAGLMLPLINYHLKDILKEVDGILDDDKNKINKFYPKLKTKISSLKNTDLKDSVALICSTASSITTRKLVELCRLKNAKIIIIPSMTI